MNKFKVNGKEIELTEEVLEVLRNIVKTCDAEKWEKEDTDVLPGEPFYKVSNGKIEEVKHEKGHMNLCAFESLHKHVLVHALIYVELSNHAQRVNDPAIRPTWKLYWNKGKSRAEIMEAMSHRQPFDVHFTSEKLAKEASEIFKDAFIDL